MASRLNERCPHGAGLWTKKGIGGRPWPGAARTAFPAKGKRSGARHDWRPASSACLSVCLSVSLAPSVMPTLSHGSALRPPPRAGERQTEEGATPGRASSRWTASARVVYLSACLPVVSCCVSLPRSTQRNDPKTKPTPPPHARTHTHCCCCCCCCSCLGGGQEEKKTLVAVLQQMARQSMW